MKQSFLDKLVCPFDKAELNIKIFEVQDEEIQEGILTCECCNRYYPIVRGIPIMSPDEYRELSLEIPLLQKWGERLLSKPDSHIFQLENKHVGGATVTNELPG
jgi:uncharacterized protein